MDEAFEAEQQHLSETYAKLQRIAADAQQSLERRLRSALGDKADMLDDLAVDFTGEVNLETYVELEAVNKFVDEFNLSNDLDKERLDKASLLMEQPYFAKVSLRMKPGGPLRDIYIGAAGIVDEDRRHFIIDWRSPVAEVYYNQEMGQTSYEANGRTITCDLELRRQFDITRDRLNAYFDTTVAIEDPLLLASLSRERSSQLKNITATIQREQNRVVRHDDVPVLLVDGIAGSGKTSVLLQRIAYLFYQQRDNLNPRDVYLITPNAMFSRYIADVLPDMGESNPTTITWNQLMQQIGLEGKGPGNDDPAEVAEQLRAIDAALSTIELKQREFADICVGDERVITAGQAFGAFNKFSRFPAGPKRCALTAEALLDKLEARINRLAVDENAQDATLALDEETMARVFGCQINPQDDNEIREYTRHYLQWRYAPVVDAIENGAWLHIDRVGSRLLGKQNISAAEWLHLKLSLAGGGNRSARYVMIDEVQDYTEPQLMALSRYFPNAHFLLLGDRNQAIRPHTATFAQIERIFAETKGAVSTCQLTTSYRSTPQVTALFSTLIDPDQDIEANSVQRPGADPQVFVFGSDATSGKDAAAATTQGEQASKPETDAYIGKLRELALRLAQQCQQSGGLAAILCAEKARVRWLSKQLDGCDFTKLAESATLPDSGVVLAPLSLAKGLEFDSVVVADASANVYDDSALSRHRLYTAISRATKDVTILSQGPLTPLLGSIA